MADRRRMDTWTREEQMAALLQRLGMHAAEFVGQADARLQGEGDFHVYHVARHSLVMTLEELADFEASRPPGEP